jgi:hypothetical protein
VLVGIQMNAVLAHMVEEEPEYRETGQGG